MLRRSMGLDDFLPLPLAPCPITSTSRSRRVRHRQGKRQLVWRDCAKVILTLNWGWTGGRLVEAPTPPWESATDGQRAAVKRIYHRVRVLLSRVETVPPQLACDEALQKLCNLAGLEMYGLEKRGLVVSLSEQCPASLVSFPSGSRPPIKMLDVFPIGMAEFYSKAENLMSPIPMLADVKVFESKGGTDVEYSKLILSFLEVGMVDFSPRRPRVVNPIFFLVKPNKKLRFIMAALLTNALMVKPKSVGLGGPIAVASTQSEGGPPGMAKSDLSDAFFNILMPDWLCDFFGMCFTVLPDGRAGWPRLRRLPMGWSHSVVVM